jgi:hypothetical protein
MKRQVSRCRECGRELRGRALARAERLYGAVYLCGRRACQISYCGPDAEPEAAQLRKGGRKETAA